MAIVPPIRAQHGQGSANDLSTTLAILGYGGGFGVWGDSDASAGDPESPQIGGGVLGTCSSRSGLVGVSRFSAGLHAFSIRGYGTYSISQGFTAVYGASASNLPHSSGVHGEHSAGTGVTGVSFNSFGVRGQSGAADLLPPVGGGPQFQRCGVQGSSDNGTGVRGDSANRIGVRGRSFHGDGVFGSCHDQSRAKQTTGNGIHGMAPRPAADANTGPFAGRFDGDVTITGRLFLSGRLVRRARSRLHPRARSIDIPDVIAGVAILDAKGNAEVAVPREIADTYKDFTYQLTSIGGASPNLHIASQLRGGKFRIAGGLAKGRVSWQITGIFNGKPNMPDAVETAIDQKQIRKYHEDRKAYEKLIETASSRMRRTARKRSRS